MHDVTNTVLAFMEIAPKGEQPELPFFQEVQAAVILQRQLPSQRAAGTDILKSLQIAAKFAPRGRDRPLSQT
jgi:hypothetical protein